MPKAPRQEEVWLERAMSALAAHREEDEAQERGDETDREAHDEQGHILIADLIADLEDWIQMTDARAIRSRKSEPTVARTRKLAQRNRKPATAATGRALVSA